jgi:Spy/CpxP family protein refolding chaperone
MQADEIRALRRLQREQGLSSHVFMTERGLALLKMLRPRGRAAALTATYAARRTATRRRAGRRWPRSSSESRQRRVNRAETITMAPSGTFYG